MTNVIRSFVWVVLAAMAGLLLIGCGESESNRPAANTSASSSATGTKPETKELTPVGLVLNWYPEPQFGGFFAADLSGAYAKHGLKVTIRSGGPDVNSLSAAEASKKLDFGVVAADEVVGRRAQGGDVVAVFASFQTNPQGIMVHKSRGLKSIEELINAGGTIAVQDALAYVKFFRKKYDMSKVRLVSYTGGIAKFRDDPQFAQQCFVTSEPIAAEQAGLMPQSFLIAESGFNPYATVVITRGQMLKENRDVVEKFVKATREGWEAYLKDPKPANEAMAKLNKAMDAPTFVASAAAQVSLVKDDFTDKEGLGAMSKERWETLVTQLVDLSIVDKDKAPKAEDCFVTIK